jgi:AraC family transcriptional regulator
MATQTFTAPYHQPELTSQPPAGNAIPGNTIPGCELSEAVYPPGLRLKFQTQGVAFFCFIQMGSVSDLYPQQTVTYSAGSLLFFPADGQHVIEFLEHTRVLIVRIGREMLSRLRMDVRRAPGPVLLQGWEGAWLIRKLHMEFVRINKAKTGVSVDIATNDLQPDRSLVLEAIVLQLLALTLRAKSERSRIGESSWLRRVRQYLDTNYLQDFRLSDLATVAGVHRVHLVREFRRRYGMTIGSHTRSLRIEHACELLVRTKLAIREIADTCKFTDQSHFTKQFKKITGLTPAEYRSFVRLD